MNNLQKVATAKRVIAGFLNLILGRKATVVWCQRTECDESGVIYLPHPKCGDADEIAILVRKALHEAGHWVHTDFSAIQDLDGDVGVLMNALEDPRIEFLQARNFKGAALILNRGVEDLVLLQEQSLDPAVPGHKARLIVLNVLIKGSRNLMAQAGYLAPANGLVAKGDQVLGLAGVQAVDHAVALLSYCQNTADVVALAKKLLSGLQASSPGEKPQTTDPDGEPDDANGQAQTERPGSSPDGVHNESLGEQTEASGDSAAPDSLSSGSKDKDQADDGGCSSDTSDSSGETVAETGNGAEEAPASEDAATEAAALDADGPGDSQTGDRPFDSAAACGSEESGLSTESGEGQTEQGSLHPSADLTSASNPASPEAHNQETTASQAIPHAAKFDLNAANGFDLGQMLQEAYEAKYGEIDVDDPASEHVQDTTVPDAAFTQLLADSLEKAEQGDMPLENALAELEIAMQAATASEGEAIQSGADVLMGLGVGNALGQKQALLGNPALVGVASHLVRIFTKELQDKRRRNVKLQPAGGRIASHLVWRLKALGDTRIFNMRGSVCGIDAAVTILLDRSGSMTRCISDAASAALACAQAFERISRVKTSIELFPGYEEGEAGATLQAYGQSVRQVAHRVDQIDAGGGTPLAEALVCVVPKLLLQRVKKRIVLLITDGSPNDMVGAIHQIQKAREAGIEFLGIGIGNDAEAIQSLVTHSIVVNEVSELADAFEALFRGNVASALTA